MDEKNDGKGGAPYPGACYNADAERSVLAACMLDEKAMRRIVTTLSAGDFFRSQHRTIFRAVERLVEKRTPIDQISVVQELAETGALEEAGGRVAVIDVASDGYAAVNAIGHARCVKRLARKRAVYRAAVEVQAAALDADMGLDALYDEVWNKMLSAMRD